MSVSKPIRFYAIGDVHISDRHLSMSKEAITNTIKHIKSSIANGTNIDIIVVMGDTLDKHDNMKISHKDMAIRFFRELSEIKTTIVLIGNHDRPNNKDWMSNLHPFMGIEEELDKSRNHITKEIERLTKLGVSKDKLPILPPKNLYFISKPRVLRIQNKYPILFMPYVPPGRFIEAITEYLKFSHKSNKLTEIKGIKDFSLIFAHQEFKGVCYGPIASTKGDDWPDDYPLVISGHIHNRHFLKDNVFYTGSLYPITMSESNDKGVIYGEYVPVNLYSIKSNDVDNTNLFSNAYTYTHTRVVSQQKEIKRINASDFIEVSAMIQLDRENTRYIIKGTPDEVAAIKSKIKGTDIQVAFDIQHKEKEASSLSFDEILRQSVSDPDVKSLLEEIIDSSY